MYGFCVIAGLSVVSDVEMCFPLSALTLWLDSRKGIRSVKSWVLVCWWWRFDWSVACLIAPIVITTSVGVRPVVRGFTCPRVHLSEVPVVRLRVRPGPLWTPLGKWVFFAVWMILDDPNPNTNPRTSGPSDNWLWTLLSPLAPIKSRVETFWYRLTQVHLEKMAVKMETSETETDWDVDKCNFCVL